MAILVIGLFIRDASKTLATGLVLGNDLAGKLNEDHVASENFSHFMHKSVIFANILEVNINDSIDMQIILAMVISVILFLSTYTGLGYLV